MLIRFESLLIVNYIINQFYNKPIKNGEKVGGVGRVGMIIVGRVVTRVEGSLSSSGVGLCWASLFLPLVNKICIILLLFSKSFVFSYSFSGKILD